MSAGRRLPNSSQISDGLNRNRSEAETTVTSLARRRLPHRLWQPIHLAAFPLLATATIHPLTAGYDRTNPAVVTMLVITSGVVVFLALFRLLHRPRHSRPGQRRPRPAATAPRGWEPAENENLLPEAASQHHPYPAGGATGHARPRVTARPRPPAAR